MAQPRPIVAEDAPAQRPSRRRIVIPIAIGVVILILAIGIPYLIYASRHVSTDDAQIDGNITTIAPKVKGQVSHLYVEDNSIVRKGDILVQIDDRDLKDAVAQAAAARAQAVAAHSAAVIGVPQQIAVTSAQIAQADAGVAQGQSGIANAQATLVAARAQLAAAQANLVKATNDQRRAHMLVLQGAISQSDADATQAAYQSALAAKDSTAEGVREAQANLDRAQAQLQQGAAELAQAQTGTDTTKIKQAQANTADAQAAAALAALQAAQLQLSYATIRAPIDGVVSKRSVNVGDFVSVGQPLMAVVDQKNIWVTANLKETQMTNVRIGQPVAIKVDAFPHEKFRGTVQSISPATGSTFALIPPDNATGNYTKVVQRVPVRIAIDQASDPNSLLRQGLSVVVTIDTTNH
ncbi:MAG TPA: HlyD family secretion protein [Vicinamibacterales bacterium]